MEIIKDNTYKVTFAQKEDSSDKFSYSVLGENFDKIKNMISSLGYNVESVREVSN